MSRSNPTASNPNPATRWFEWKGSEGKLVWYDKEKKENIEAPKGFRFLVLDQLNTVTGYNKKAKSGIHSNEVRESTDILVVKYFSGDIIAEGSWTAIKKDVIYEKGKFAKSVYIAFKDGDELKIGNIKMSGSALGPWFDFSKKHRSDLDTKAVLIKAGEKDTTGDVEFIPPAFSIIDANDETNAAAKLLDIELQKFLDGYFKRTKIEQIDQRTGHEDEPDGGFDALAEGEDGGHPNPTPPSRGRQSPPADVDMDDSSVPF